MGYFKEELARRQVRQEGRRWLFVPYDQVTDQTGPLSREDLKDLGIVLVENRWKAARRPYHKQKLALILANLRHFALEQADRGVAVRHVVADGPYAEALEPLIAELGPLRVMVPAERELTDWFWVAYTDAYDWVVEPNVLGMGTYALAGLMTTKPYVSGAAYINRMSDYCGLCAFDPKTDCPFASLYWAFLARHKPALKSNPRLTMPMASLRKRSASRKKQDQEVYKKVREILGKGEKISPKDLS